MNRFIFKFQFSTVSQSLKIKAQANQMQNVIRFENQNQTWTLKELDRHSDAFAYGLVQLGHQQGSVLGLLLNKEQSIEIIVSQMGALKAGVTVKPINSNLKDNLKDCNSFIYNPNVQIDSNTVQNSLDDLIPEMKDTFYGDILNSKNYPKLKNLIHTGFYSLNGTYKFRQFLVYNTKNFNTLKLKELEEKEEKKYIESLKQGDYHNEYFQGVLNAINSGNLYKCI